MGGSVMRKHWAGGRVRAGAGAGAGVRLWIGRIRRVAGGLERARESVGRMRRAEKERTLARRMISTNLRGGVDGNWKLLKTRLAYHYRVH